MTVDEWGGEAPEIPVVIIFNTDVRWREAIHTMRSASRHCFCPEADTEMPLRIYRFLAPPSEVDQIIHALIWRPTIFDVCRCPKQHQYTY